jgi:hypothetical protein
MRTPDSVKFCSAFGNGLAGHITVLSQLWSYSGFEFNKIIKKTKHFSHTKIFNELIDYLVSGKISRSGRYHQSMVEIAATLWANRLRQLVAMG